MTTVQARAAGPGRLGQLRAASPIIPFVVLLLIWAGIVAIFEPRTTTLPPIQRIANTAWSMISDGSLWTNILASLERLVYGAITGVVTGVVLGVIAGLNRRVAKFFEPLIMFFSGLSGIVWIPLAIAWLGIGRAMVIFVIWNSVFFLVFSNTMLGVQLVPRVLEDGVQTLGASRWHTILHVTIPGALPNMMAGIRAGLGFGWRALIAAELVGASSGLGHMIYSASQYLRSDIIITGCIVIGLMGMTLDRLVLHRLEMRTIARWGMVSDE
ncbi:MAG: ABC transporter permease subunit [Actinobacteria bacterium]|nr:ABC transporter permease subunit [Actinomycetota bacterium]